MAKINEKMLKMEKHAMKKFEKKFLQYQVSKRRHVSTLEMEIKELKDQVTMHKKGYTIGDVMNISLDRFIIIALLALIVLISLYFMRVI